VKNGDKNEKEDKSSPALEVAAALDGGGEGAGGGGALLCLRAEKSSGPWTARNVAIEKITLAAVKNGDKNEKEDEYLPALAVGAVWMVEERELVAAQPYCVCGLSNQVARGQWVTF
jgi:hypothetical protein